MEDAKAGCACCIELVTVGHSQYRHRLSCPAKQQKQVLTQNQTLPETEERVAVTPELVAAMLPALPRVTPNVECARFSLLPTAETIMAPSLPAAKSRMAVPLEQNDVHGMSRDSLHKARPLLEILKQKS